MKQVLCLGELLIDFICEDVGMGLIKGEKFSKKAGGAPANVAAAVAKLGGKSAFIGKVGDDHFGEYLREYLSSVGVDTSGVITDMRHSTTLAFVSLQDDGERDFIFNRGADRCLTRQDIDQALVGQSSIIHFGAATAFLADPLATTYTDLLQKARIQKKFISFDPNYRADLWRGRAGDFVEAMRAHMHDLDLVKMSEEEATHIFHKADLEECCRLAHKVGIKAVAITLGEKGTLLSIENKSTIIESISVKSVDSTGAGDAFVGGLLFKIAGEHPTALNANNFRNYVSFANRVGAATCTRFGAMEALPGLNEIEESPG